MYRDGQERQEFSFTLYDFDGHGKITKDVSLSLLSVFEDCLLIVMSFVAGYSWSGNNHLRNDRFVGKSSVLR